MKNKYEIHPFVMLLASVLVAVFYFTYVYPMMKTEFERLCFTIPTLIFDVLLFYTSLKDLIKTYFKNGGVMKKGGTSKSYKSKSETVYSSPLLRKVKKLNDAYKLKHKGELTYRTKQLLSLLGLFITFLIGSLLRKFYHLDILPTLLFVFIPVPFFVYYSIRFMNGYEYPEKRASNAKK